MKAYGYVTESAIVEFFAACHKRERDELLRVFICLAVWGDRHPARQPNFSRESEDRQGGRTSVDSESEQMALSSADKRGAGHTYGTGS